MNSRFPNKYIPFRRFGGRVGLTQEAPSRAKQAGVGAISTASSVPFSAPVSWSTESTTSAGYTATASTDSTSPATATEPTS